MLSESSDETLSFSINSLTHRYSDTNPARQVISDDSIQSEKLRTGAMFMFFSLTAGKSIYCPVTTDVFDDRAEPCRHGVIIHADSVMNRDKEIRACPENETERIN